MTFLRSYFSTFTNWIRLSTIPLKYLNTSKYEPSNDPKRPRLTRNDPNLGIHGPPVHLDICWPLFEPVFLVHESLERESIWNGFNHVTKILTSWHFMILNRFEIKLEVKSNWSFKLNMFMFHNFVACGLNRVKLLGWTQIPFYFIFSIQIRNTNYGTTHIAGVLNVKEVTSLGLSLNDLLEKDKLDSAWLAWQKEPKRAP